MKASDLSTALSLHSDKSVLFYILAHIHDNRALGLSAWHKNTFIPVAEYSSITVVIIKLI